eukprot:gene8846-11244_t
MSLKNLAAILDPQAPADRPFIIQVSPEGDEQLRLSYGEARARIAGLARGLLKRGLKRGEAVAIVAANSADYLVLYMATMAAGLVSVCVNHKLPRETVAHIMKDSVVKLLALVTGGIHRVGAAISARLAREGYALALHKRTAAEADP